MRSLASLFTVPTPEKIAAKELHDMRLALFQAERRLMEAQMQVDYYRDLVAFLEDVAARGVESVVDQRRAAAGETTKAAAPQVQPQQPAVQPARIAPGFATVVPTAA